MDLQMAGRTAIVTGASRGIGLATVRRLSAEGVRVMGVARTRTPELIESAEVVLSLDLTDRDSARRALEVCLREFGGLDLLVNNAGGADAPNIGGFSELTDDDWDDLLELNLLSAVRMTRAALPSLLDRRGAIVTVSSVGAHEPAMPGLAYNAAKAALSAFAKGLASEVAGSGVRVTTVDPGPVRTPMWTSPDALGGRLANAAGVPLDTFLDGLPAAMGVPTGRLIDPDEVADLIAFLLSPTASSITGSSHRIDGGLVRAV